MIHLPRKRYLMTGMLVCGLLAFASELEAADEPTLAADSNHLTDVTRTFFAEHCLRCHGSAKAQGNLRLDQLDSDLSNPATLERWLQITARLQSGEMPPQDEPRPQPEKLTALLSQLITQLESASATQRRAGRVVLRRLNRVEYQNTLNDLFNVNVSVKDMLPEDAVAAGFDNVGAALNISPVFIERCLDAIDAALDAAIAPVHQIANSQQRFDLYDSLPAWFLAGVWKQPEGVILFRTSGNSATDLRKFRAPAGGRYRFRVAASAQ
ncbi:MAG UNVERIFIED_CONTAM: DUF1587 domain-containing protein [Planctomycetaceae bacterium]